MATFAPPSAPGPDDWIWRHAQGSAEFYNANRHAFEQAARLANEMAPTIRMIRQMASTNRPGEVRRRS